MNSNNTSYNNNNKGGAYVSGNAPQGGNFTDVQRGILAILREHQSTQEGVPVQYPLPPALSLAFLFSPTTISFPHLFSSSRELN